MEETSDVSPCCVLTDGFDEGKLEIVHELDMSIEEARRVLLGNRLHGSKEPVVDLLTLRIHQAVDHGAHHSIAKQRVNDDELN